MSELPGRGPSRPEPVAPPVPARVGRVTTRQVLGMVGMALAGIAAVVMIYLFGTYVVEMTGL